MRIKRGVNAVKKRRKIFRLSKGYFGSKSRSYRIAREAVMKSLMYAYIGRKRRKRDFRQLWIARINAAARMNGLSYSKFMHGRGDKPEQEGPCRYRRQRRGSLRRPCGKGESRHSITRENLLSDFFC